MNIVMECETTLSKKLEKICENGENITLHITSIRGNKGRTLMRMSINDGISIKDVTDIGDTSLMLKILKVDEDVPDFPSGNGAVSFFEAENLRQGEKPEKLVAAYVSPEVKEGKPWQGKRPEQTNALMQDRVKEEEVKQKPVRKDTPTRIDSHPISESIMSYEELLRALSEVKDIDREIAIPENRNLTRQEAIKIEMSVPRMSKRCYIGNCLKSCLAINDIAISEKQCLSMVPGQAIDLSRMPAKKIRDSSDLEWCIRTGKVKFVTHDEYIKAFEDMANVLEGNGRSSLQVFDRSSEARAALANFSNDKSESIVLPSDITETEVNENTQVAYEDDRDMDRLLSSMPK